MTTAILKLPPKLVDVFKPARGELRFRCAYGGRGSGKSFTFALMAAVWGYAEPLRILCTRELQNSIKESMHAEIKNAIETTPWLAAHYDIGEAFIRGKNGTEFIFKGLRHNISSIKSMAQIDLCIVEEAADVPRHSWQALLPTIRAEKSEIWAVWNPKNETDPIDEMMRKNPPPRAMAVEMQWRDNPWLPKELKEQRQYAQQVMSPEEYAWIWEGQYLTASDAQVLKGKWRVADFTPEPTWDGPYFGADWGFSQDPTTLVKCWISGKTLYIEHEAYGVGVEITETPALFDSIPGSRNHVIRADSARPETISHMKRQGFNVVAAKKGAGSVEEGIMFLRSFAEIVIHTRCRHTQDEARLYSYKVDRLTGDVLPVLVDAHNHVMDAVRYALEPMIKKRNDIIFEAF
jgi:phage terminase large subunit